jgi:uncharacterized repeat protein (TIGR03803 family)
MKTKLFPIILTILLLSCWAAAQHYGESTLVSFPSLPNGPVFPTGGLIISSALNSAGNLYGVAEGGANGLGVIFQVTPEGAVSLLHSFSGSDGAYPEVDPVRDLAGNLYGVTSQGGGYSSCSCGTIYKLSPAGDFTVLHSFTGSYAYASTLVLDSAGNLYGFEYSANANGSIFKVSPEGVFSLVYTFCALENCADGSLPAGRLILNRAGEFYGVTNRGGAFNQGAVFQLTAAYKESVVYSFTGSGDGGNPVGKLTQDAEGNMYGVTYAGGAAANPAGALFKISAKGTESVLYSFCRQSDCSDGSRPSGPLVRDVAGNLYGTTMLGGAYNAGVVFKVTPKGTESVLENLTVQADGGNGAVVDVAGNVYVEIYSGGVNGEGSILKLAAK